jgi:hypothetical protein
LDFVPVADVAPLGIPVRTCEPAASDATAVHPLNWPGFNTFPFSLLFVLRGQQLVYKVWRMHVFCVLVLFDFFHLHFQALTTVLIAFVRV